MHIQCINRFIVNRAKERDMHGLKTLVILMGLSSFLASSCSKGEDDCPDCVYEVFECKVNGEQWGPDCDSGTILWGCSAIDCLYYNDTKRLNIRVVSESRNQRMLISCYDLSLGINPIYYGRGEFLDYDLAGNCGRYDLDTTKGHFMNIITVDTINFIVEGEFGFTAISVCDGVNDTIMVTEGKFLLGYRF